MVTGKKTILIVLLLSLSICASTAATSNDLLKMDIKKSSLQDAVDVTFYTTGGTTNSVVTRKSDNRYVVLLPNVAGSQSVAPNIGGVKDLITNIDVKNINDGIGGYTKVTFTTSKPVKIQTAMKNTLPLTKAQEEYKNLIAQNKNTKPAKTQSAPKKTPAANNVKPVPAAAPKPVVNHSNNKQVKNPVAVSFKDKPVQKSLVKTPVKTPVKAQAVPSSAAKTPVNQPVKIVNNVPAVAPVSKPVSVPAAKPKTAPTAEEKIPQNAPAVKETPKNPAPVQNSLPVQPEKYPLWLYLTAGIAGLLVLRFLTKLFSRKKKRSGRQNSNEQPVYVTKFHKKELNTIADDKNLSWQEKYNLYNQTNEKYTEDRSSDLTYVTDTSSKKKTIIEDHKPSYKVNEITDTNSYSLDSIPEIKENGTLDIIKKNEPKKFSFKNSRAVTPAQKAEAAKDELRAKISQMEHALNQTPDISRVPEPKKNLYSDEDAITGRLSAIKLKSFAKPVLNSAHRMLLGAEKIPADKMQEGKFVKLNNSPLNISTRKSTSSEINGSDYYKNYGEMNMNKNDNYSVSSLNEYFSILDSEERNSQRFAKPSKTEVVAGRVSNPIKSSRNIQQETLGGRIVKSSYNIDSQKGFYIVDTDGGSALVGRINDNIFLLKQFDITVDKKLQVRLDYGNVYIVRIGAFKCLVEVSKDKMGTLLEI